MGMEVQEKNFKEDCLPTLLRTGEGMVNFGELEVGIGNGSQGCQVVVLGMLDARRESRVCIELGVQENVVCMCYVTMCLIDDNDGNCLRNEMIEQEARENVDEMNEILRYSVNGMWKLMAVDEMFSKIGISEEEMV
ncbi:hypothetical protein PIB30_030090 [Stylosanthes scabra]|uniref:Uncharacterized protein n=1 Tax=Stylosanthes scabra TaxID=79078 RepID=A0ABU6W9K1_9FABA|nr:hypothetical protein [Stylosanthes scabra]